MATRNPRKTIKEKAAESSAANLIAGLEFISVAQREAGDPMQTFCQMGGGLLFGTDGALSAGCKIEDQIEAFAHTTKLLAALKRCTEQITMVQSGDGNHIKIKSGKFTASIPCYNKFDKGNFLRPEPDPIAAQVTNAVKDALKACYPLTIESSPFPHTAGVLLQDCTAVGTNGMVLIEYWHGINLPPNILLPKAAAAAIANCPKNLKSFGFSDRSATFYFDDDSFIKTQLFEATYPNFGKLFEVNNTLIPVPDDLFKGLDHVLPFSPNHQIFFDDNLIKSTNAPEPTTYEVAGIPGEMGFNGQFLKLCEKHTKTVDFSPENCTMYFYGENVRGLLKGLAITRKDENDDIPF